MVLIDHTLTVNQLIKFEPGFLHWSRKKPASEAAGVVRNT